MATLGADQSSAPVEASKTESKTEGTKTKEPQYYHDYLQLDKVLGAQRPQSLQQSGKLAHDEMLFIIIHQTYELWFKQILHELDSAIGIFNHSRIDEKDMLLIVLRLRRIVEIQRVLLQQLTILETMSAVSFLDFRDFLFPASGFQSVQFRTLENKLGLERSRRLKYAKADYDAHLAEEHKKLLGEVEKEPSLLSLVDKWLSRMPFLQSQDFDFLVMYKKVVGNMFAKEREELKTAPADYASQRLADITNNEKMFSDYFDESKYSDMQKEGKVRLSYKASQAAIMINLFQEEPIFQAPFQVLQLLLDIDEQLTNWRGQHANMVHRMLGIKTGTGGSSGFHYLKATATHHRIFDDFFNLSVFLVPRSFIPALPSSILKQIRFQLSSPDSPASTSPAAATQAPAALTLPVSASATTASSASAVSSASAAASLSTSTSSTTAAPTSASS